MEKKVSKHNVECEESVIKVKTIFSQDKKYRYYLKKTWGKGEKNIAFLMYNPSKADSLKSDNTINNATNYAIDREFDSICNCKFIFIYGHQ